MARLKAVRSKFETISGYIDPTSSRSYGTVVLSDGARLAATDGFGLISVMSDSHAPGSYRASGEVVAAIRPPEFGGIVDASIQSPGREVQPAELLLEILSVSSKKPLFVGIGRHTPDVVILAAKPCKHGFGERVWFSSKLLKRWFGDVSADACIRIQDETLVATEGDFVRLLSATTAVD